MTPTFIPQQTLFDMEALPGLVHGPVLLQPESGHGLSVLFAAEHDCGLHGQGDWPGQP